MATWIRLSSFCVKRVWLLPLRRLAASLLRAWFTLLPPRTVGVVVEVNAETDFVAKNDKFVDFVKDVAKSLPRGPR